MAIRVSYHKVKFRLESSTRIKAWINNVISEEGKFTGEISVVFSDNESILEINKEFLKHDYYTDVISFNYSKGDIIEGEIYISIDKVKENALEYGDGIKRETMRVIIHGVLHLLGYNDSTKNEIKNMRRAEEKYLAFID